ncbi:OmpH family outer membrane protein [Nitrincola nitratireducens]|uniref:Periplasmic chaperone n=1 Tax=Nitrincola nitratireducens TaxID=1229521 RepID=W9V540_9GAMM|nr:OmpH family outer membrane protein [Nitrincola nitratireducens]EXJ12051.1 periplasmic chaperone [Nitrincola nitratireducens]
MKIKGTLILLMLVFSSQAFADRFRVLGVQEALLSSKAAEDFRASMEREFAAEERALIELERQAVAVRDRIQQNQGLIPDQEMEQLHLQFQKAFTEYQTRGEAMAEKQIEREQEFLTSMRPKLDQAIRSLIENENIDVVFAKQATVYASGTIDITPRVIELLNRQ